MGLSIKKKHNSYSNKIWYENDDERTDVISTTLMQMGYKGTRSLKKIVGTKKINDNDIHFQIQKLTYILYHSTIPVHTRLCFRFFSRHLSFSNKEWKTTLRYI